MKGPDVQVRRGDGAKRQGPLVKQPKAHHFVPVAHLVRFSASPEVVPSRDRVLHLYDKRTGLFRSAKARNVAYKNDLYTIRAPDLSGVEPEPGQLHRAVFDPANKDADIEAMKIGIEAAGLEVMREIDGWDSGPREVGHEQKAALHTYIGLLLAQHPTMMGARAVAIQQRFWASAAARGKPVPALQAMFDELSAGAGVLALVMDAFATALELNYLAWKVIRWPEGPRLILGDVGVAAAYPPGLLGVGDSWADDAKFFLPIGPNTLVVVGGLAPGRCVVEARVGNGAETEVASINRISWARSRSEAYGGHQADLERTLAMLAPLDPRADYSMQVEVRGSVLPDFMVDDDGELEIIQPPDPSPEETDKRFAERFHVGRDGRGQP